jgi:hypothetical protein
METLKGLSRMALIGVMLLSGACAVFALVMNAYQSWQEHAHAAWPVVTGQVQQCKLGSADANAGRSYFACDVSYAVGDQQYVARIDRPVSGAADVARVSAWMTRNPAGTAVQLRYDPANHGGVEMVSYFPLAHGLVEQTSRAWAGLCGAIFVASLLLVWATRPREDWRRQFYVEPAAVR